MIRYIALCTLVLVAPFALTVVTGAPYLPTLRRDYEEILDALDLPVGATVVDLGSGDGRFLRAVARRGVRGVGYEVNPILWLVSRVVVRTHGDLVRIHLANYWRRRLPPADAVYVFQIARIMPALDRKLVTELTHPAYVVTNGFPMPGRTPVAAVRGAYVYRYGPPAI